MNGFGVFYCGYGDDIPVLLTADRAEADRLAEELDTHYSESDEGEFHHPKVLAAVAVTGRDIGTFITIAVGTFKGGELVAWEPIGVGVDD